MGAYLDSIKKRSESYKLMAEKAFDQVNDDSLFWQYNAESNSIAFIIQHMAGNMLSRWTHFLTSDGEKDWRNRDSEFEPTFNTREELLQRWNAGWKCLTDALNSLTEDDFEKQLLIRNEPHTVIDAINRQLLHNAYHVGQIVFTGKMIAGNNWHTLSVAKGQSAAFNAEKFKK